MLLEFMKNRDCPTTYWYHMPLVVVYVVPYAVSACWRPHRCCTPIANFLLAYVLKSRTLPLQNHKTIPRICQTWLIHSWARSPTIERLSRASCQGLCSWRTSLSRTAAPCLPLGGRVARVGMLSFVGRCPWSGYVAAGWYRPTCVDFPTALPRQTRARPPAKAWALLLGVAVGDGYQHGAENAHKSGGEPDARDRHVASYRGVSAR
jgi:hypothetical protein